MCDKDLHEEVKKIIIGILTSTPFQMNVNQLKKDYQDIVGEHIPYTRLGFICLDDYLQSVPDVVKVHGRGPGALLELVITKKSAHINKLISKQKVTVKNKRRWPRQKRFFAEEQHKKNTQSLQRLQLANTSKQKYYNEPVPSCSYSVPNEEPDDEVLEIISLSSDDTNMEITNDIFKEIRDRDNIRVPINVQQNIKSLICMYEDGIWCADIPMAYKKRYKETLDYLSFGYNSVAQLCSDLGDSFNFIKPGKGDIKIYDKSFVIKNPINPNISLEKNLENVEQGTASSALPAQIGDIVEEHYSYKCPSNIVKYGDIMETIKVTDFEKNDYISVKVAEIYDPSKFWIIVNGDNCSVKLDHIMDDMQTFYGQNSYNYVIPECLIKVGTYCAAIIYNEYHRAVIVGLVNNDKENVKVFFVDYGTVTTLPSKGICFLRKDFFELPQQAIRARLFGIYPINTDTQWSRTNAARFHYLVQKRDLYAEILRIDSKRNALELILADTTTDEDIFINDTLVNDGHALFTHQEQKKIVPQFKPIVKYIHLFPMFDEIELGIVPSAMEMVLLKNLDIHTIYPHYFEPAFKRNVEDNDNDVEFHVRRPKDCLNHVAETTTTIVSSEGEKLNIVTNESFINQMNPCDDPPLRRPKDVHVLETPVMHKQTPNCNPYMNNILKMPPPPPGFFHINRPVPFNIVFPNPQMLPPLYIPHDMQLPIPINENFQVPFTIYPTPNMHYMQMPKIIQNQEMGNLNTQLNKCNLNNHTVSAAAEELNTITSYSQNDIKFISIHDFRDDILHVINYNNQKYLLMNEVINKFINEEMSVVRIRRILAKDHSIKLLILDLNNNKDLQMEMIRLKLIKEDDNVIRLVLSNDVPNLVQTLSKEFLDAEEYETFLLNIK